MNLAGQDWDQVVLRKKPQTTSQKTSSAAVNAAIRSGMYIPRCCRGDHAFPHSFSNQHTARHTHVDGTGTLITIIYWCVMQELA
jgi:hypothetical protein